MERVALTPDLEHEVDFIVNQFGDDMHGLTITGIFQKITNFISQLGDLLHRRFGRNVLMLSLDNSVGIDQLNAQIVSEAVGKFYDKYLEPLDIPYVPGIIEGWLDPTLKELLQKVALGIYNELARYFKNDVPEFGSDPMPLKGLTT